MRVCILPNAEQIREPNFGIARVVTAQYNYLPALGIELVSNPEQADVVVSHVNRRGLERVDVLHCHGLYWSDQNSIQYSWHVEANSGIIEAVRSALVVTVPSRWVAQPFQRDMRISPHVIPHGIDFHQWEKQNPSNYVLWNKNRNTDVCDPTPALWLAQKGINVITTFLPVGVRSAPRNLVKIGVLSFSKMKPVIERASIYLATAPETFGIGTLEAMAAGVPILGYNWAGTAELVQHQETGYLVEPGNLEGLLEGYHWILEHRNELSRNARERAGEYDWSKVIHHYADLYQDALYLKKREKELAGVSVIITCYNYARFLPEAVTSVLNQVVKPREIILVNDGSTDESLAIMRRFQSEHPELIKVIDQPNSGVAAARNAGAALARYSFLICLDADDRLKPEFIMTVLPELVRDRGLGIAYTGVTLIDDSGRYFGKTNFPPEFSWETQAAPHVPPSNCIPSACLFRRSMWERAGGWYQEFAPGEDAEFWTRALSIGFRAKRVSEDGLFEYRLHEGSASRTNQYKPIDVWLPWMRDKDYPMGAPAKTARVRSYLTPRVSVIIPVGNGHENHIHQAIRSLLGQTERQWELILVDDTDGDELSAIVSRRYPFARLVKTVSPSRHSPAAARNSGLQHVKAPYTLFLDADDYLAPTALETMLGVLPKDANCYVYSDWYEVSNGDKPPILHHCADFDPSAPKLQHAVTILLPTKIARSISFDEDLPGLEEWTYSIKLRLQGCCGVRIPQPLLYYNVNSGSVRARWQTQPEKVIKTIKKRYPDYFRTEALMPCGNCPGSGREIIRAKESMGIIPKETSAASIETSGDFRLEYVGVERGTRTFSYKGRQYRGGNNTFARFITVRKEHAEDVQFLVSTGLFRVISSPVSSPKPAEPPSKPVEPPESGETAILDPSESFVQQEQPAESQAESQSETPVIRPRPESVRALKAVVRQASVQELMEWAYQERVSPAQRTSYLEVIQEELDRR